MKRKGDVAICQSLIEEENAIVRFKEFSHKPNRFKRLILQFVFLKIHATTLINNANTSSDIYDHMHVISEVLIYH